MIDEQKTKIDDGSEVKEMCSFFEFMSINKKGEIHKICFIVCFGKISSVVLSIILRKNKSEKIHRDWRSIARACYIYV